MELTLAILLIIAFAVSKAGDARRRNRRRARCRRLSEDTAVIRGAQVISIEECAERYGQTLYDQRRACR